MYSDFRDTRVTAGYQKCVYKGARSNCAVYIKKQDTLAFLDFCKITEYVSPVSSRFYTVSKTAQNTYGPESIKPITCKPILLIQEEDEETWKAIIPANQYFKCAQIGDGNYITYVVNKENFDKIFVFHFFIFTERSALMIHEYLGIQLN